MRMLETVMRESMEGAEAILRELWGQDAVARERVAVAILAAAIFAARMEIGNRRLYGALVNGAPRATTEAEPR